MISTFVISYLVMYRPYKDRRMANLEVFNELTFVAMTYNLCCFSDFIPEAETRSKVGYSFIAFAIINIMVHLFFVLQHTLITLRDKLCRKCILKRREQRAIVYKLERMRERRTFKRENIGFLGRNVTDQ